MEEMKTVEALANGVKWSKYIPKVPTPKQLAGMMMVNVKELLYGGALGGGKSEFLAMEALRFCDLPGFSSIIFRRQLTDLSMPGALMERIGQWLGPHKQAGACRYDGEQHTWSFKTVWPGTDIPGPEAKLQFGYIGGAEIRHRYQSAEYQLVAFDELGQWPDNVDYLFMHTRIRKNVCPIHGKDSTGNPNYVSNCHHCTVLSQIPLRMRSASNPGMVWVKKRFGIKPDPSLYTTPRQALLAIAEGKKVKWVGTDPEARFLASYLWDNPHLDWNSYNKMLKELPEHQRSQLQDGNWEARVNSRFKRQWQQFVQLNLPEPYLVETHDDISYFEGRNFREGSYDKVTLDSQGNIHLHESIPLTSLQRVFLTADVAVTVSQGPVDSEAGKKHSSSALSTWGVTKHQELLWLHSRKLDVEIPDLVSNAMDLNQIWQPSMNKIEVTGVGIGLAQYLERAGLPVMKNWKKKDKLENSICAQLIMKAGRVLFPINARWLEDAEDDIFQWTGLPSEPDDRIDTFSDAANELGLEVAKEISGNKTTVSCRPRAIGTIGNISNGRFSGFPGLNPPKYF
jgi:phage terminase large subunit-like protein